MLTTVTLVPTGVLGGPSSPLVLYGDTSQDGLWYSGNPATVDGYEFGDKPFNPFIFVPDARERGRRVGVPARQPVPLAGNDVIDASALFADIVCDATCSNLPTVGITAYGGAGNDTIIGSQTGDHLAGGSGDDTILGLRGNDHIYGDSGVNVDVLTRGLTIPTANAGFTSANVDLLLVPGHDTLYGEGAGTIGTAGTGTETGFDDVIFGDHGRVTQLVADPNQPNPLLQKIQTTGFIRDIATVRPSRRRRRRDPRQRGPRPDLRRQRQRPDHRRRRAERDLRRPRPPAVRRRHDRRDDAAPGREHRLRARRRRRHHGERRGTTSSSAASRAT